MSDVETDEMSGNEIAIIGMVGRFPKAKDIQEFWHNLSLGVEGITFFTPEELESCGVPAQVVRDPRFVPAKGMLEDADVFDATFFGYSPGEALLIDPQQRVFLEYAWQALEVAGYDAQRFPGLIGVYAGSSMNMYLPHILQLMFRHPHLGASIDSLQLTIANDKDFLATRVSYKLGLHGPALAVQTACSTSLVAVHLACQSLLNFECDMALAGGVSIQGVQKGGYYYQEGKISSPDGHCRAFDAQAQGCVAGNGVGIVVLKRLSEALAAGDTIHAVIKGTACNNDGAQKVGYTAPSTQGQAKVIAEAQSVAQVHPETVTYIEAHGTATPLGDPIEVAALTQAFRLQTDKTGYCALGSVKTNIGHLNAAAGVAGLIKTVQALEHRQLPPSLHFSKPNPQIDFAHSPFYVNTSLSPWAQGETPRRAGVSSFGIGGTNAHVVLEEAPAPGLTTPSLRDAQVLLLSARTETALQRARTNLLEHLLQNPQLNLADVAYTLQVGRKIFPHRLALICRNNAHAGQVLSLAEPEQFLQATEEATQRPVIFLFPGQGAQYVNMTKGLYQTEPVFRAQVDFCAQFLQPLLNLDLRSVLYAEDAAAEEKKALLQQTWLTQPALFVVEYALAMLWRSWGVQPAAMIGHSIGEYVAACLAGVFSREEALRLVVMRGRCMQKMPPGAMLAVTESEANVRSWLAAVASLDEGPLSLAAINAPTQYVISGAQTAIGALEKLLLRNGVNCRRLQTSHAFHSALAEPILDEFCQYVSSITLHAPQSRYISNLTGTWITATQALSPKYWVDHLRQAVLFSAGIEVLLSQEADAVFLEVGPGRSLSSFVSQVMRARPALSPTPPVLASLRRVSEERSDSEFLCHALASLWLSGVEIDWARLYTHETRRRVPLPAYPFEGQRFWFDVQPSSQPAETQEEVQVSLQIPVQAEMPARHPRPALSVAYMPPRNELEQQIVAVWSEMLGIDAIGIYDNFFDLGGHSLLATQVVARVRDVVHADVPLRALFEKPTVAAFVQALALEQQPVAEGILPAPIRTQTNSAVLSFPLSFSQQRLWFLDRLEPGSAFYNLPLVLRLSGTLDIGALQRSLVTVIQRHEILRTTFALHADEAIQIVHPSASFGLQIVDFSGLALSVSEIEARQIARQEDQLPFDLVTGPLLRIKLLLLAPREYALVLTMHHIITDAWSNSILLREVATLYASFVRHELAALPPLSIQYADFAVWQRQHLQGEYLESLVHYWREKLRGIVPFHFPTDYASSAEARSYRGARQAIAVPLDVSQALDALGKQEGATLFMTLLAAFQALLYRQTGQKDVTLGTDIANRTQVELETLIGFFVNVLLLRTDFSAELTFRELLRNVRETVLGAYAHQDLPFEMLVDIVKPDRALEHVPLVQVLFVLQNAPAPRADWPGLTLRTGNPGVQTSRFDLSVFMYESAEGLKGSFIYSTDLFREETIKHLAERFVALLQHIVLQPDALVATLDLQTEEEKQQHTLKKRERRAAHLGALFQAKEDTIQLHDLS